MDADRFDALSRSLHPTVRRTAVHVLGVLAGAGLAAGLNLTETEARKKRGKGRNCPTCPRPTVCPNVPFCADKPDFTDCGDGKKCSGGVCAPEPTCKGQFASCSSRSECCSDSCFTAELGDCLCSGRGKPCHDTRDCCFNQPLACVAFTCVLT